MLRWWQDVARKVDVWLYPVGDPDVPGVTYLSPVEWAPWMETIWFGNAYDYRSAYFQDVMYSNNVPFREGALLYKDAFKARQIALLYQRYKKFDASSYALSNATFFNVFGSSSLRVGRYKVPLSDELILCTTDPLTFTEMQRYFISLSPLKWFKSKFMQQKRKRQYIMNINAGRREKNGGSDGDADFFEDAVRKIEYGRWEMASASLGTKRTIPISPIVLPLPPQPPQPETGSFVIPIGIANSQYFLENLVQTVLNHYKPESVWLGGDGRLFNTFALHTALQIVAGNIVNQGGSSSSSSSNNIFVAQNGILTTSAAISAMASADSKGRRPQGQGGGGLALVFTASDEAGGVRGSFGLQLVVTKNEEGAITSTPIVASHRVWLDLVHAMSQTTKANMKLVAPKQVKGESTQFDPIPAYLASLKAKHDLASIKSFLQDSGLIFSIDCMNGAASPFASALFKELDQDPALLINANPLPDFGGVAPNPNPFTGGAKEFSSIFQVSSFLPNLSVMAASISGNDQRVVVGNVEEEGKAVSDIGLDVGFALDANAQNCGVFSSRVCVLPRESAAILGTSVVDNHDHDGLAKVLSWLGVLSKRKKGSSLAMGVQQELVSLWKRQGRIVDLLFEFPVSTSQEAMSILRSLISASQEETGFGNENFEITVEGWTSSRSSVLSLSDAPSIDNDGSDAAASAAASVNTTSSISSSIKLTGTERVHLSLVEDSLFKSKHLLKDAQATFSLLPSETNAGSNTISMNLHATFAPDKEWVFVEDSNKNAQQRLESINEALGPLVVELLEMAILNSEEEVFIDLDSSSVTHI